MKKVLIYLFALLFISTTYAATEKAIQPNGDDLMRFQVAYAQIKQFYVHDKKDEELFSNALRGLLSGLDPHSVYFDKEALKEFKANSEGNFIGIGVEITIDKKALKIVTPLDGSPAEKAGIKAGDYIIAVNNKPLMDVTISKAMKLLRGKPGSKVTLTVVNKKDKKPRKITIIREKIHISSVRSELLDHKYGYIRISQFQSDTGKKVIQAVKKLKKQAKNQLAGLILDLRNNPGGLLDGAIEVTDAFLDIKPAEKKKIVYTQGRFEQAQSTYHATAGDITKGLPLIVLINEGSASASEIVAGALQDYKRGLIMGQPSFGKGSVQTLLPLDEESAIKLTTALYYTPKGRSIQAHGIQPDILVENLEIKKDKEDALVFLKIHESTLGGHLKNGQGKKNHTKTNNARQLAARDYQLNEALNAMKALVTVQRIS